MKYTNLELIAMKKVFNKIKKENTNNKKIVKMCSNSLDKINKHEKTNN